MMKIESVRGDTHCIVVNDYGRQIFEGTRIQCEGVVNYLDNRPHSEELTAMMKADGIEQADDFRIAETISTLLDRHYTDLAIATANISNKTAVVEPAKDARSVRGGRYSVVYLTFDNKHYQIEVECLD